MKLKKVISTLLLLGLLLVSISPLFEAKTAKAYNASIIYGPNFHVDYLDLAGEEQLTRDVCTFIMNQFNYYGSNYAWLYKCVDASATRSTYGTVAYSADNYYDAATVFSKGHASQYTCGGPMHHFLMDTNGLHVEDYYIGQNALNGRHHFVCLWHCGTTMDYPGTTCPYCGGRTSFPYAWTTDNNMNLEAYTTFTGNYVFIGHEGWSPQLLNPTGYGNNNYGVFVACLYTYLVQYGLSIYDAVSIASAYTLGSSDLTQTQLYTLTWIDPPDPPPPNPAFPGMYSRMHIYGNGNLGVPS